MDVGASLVVRSVRPNFVEFGKNGLLGVVLVGGAEPLVDGIDDGGCVAADVENWKRGVFDRTGGGGLAAA